MQIRTLTVSSSSKLPHPSADFASVSSMVTLEAVLSDDDNLATCAKKLQAQAWNLVEQDQAAIAERLRQRASSVKPQAATNNTAAELAAKHGGKL